MDTDRRDDAAGGGAVRVEAARGPEEPEAVTAAGSGEAVGVAEAGRAPAAADPAAPAPDAALLPAPDGGPPVPAAPGWLRPQPAPGPGPYGPKPYLPGPYVWVPPAGPANGAGIAALTLGIIGATLAFTLLLSPLAVVLGGLAVGFGVTAVRRVRRGEARNRASGLWGIWLGGVAAVVGVGMSILLVVLAMDYFAPVSPETDSAVEAGETIAYDDGLEVTLDARPVPGGLLEVHVRVENGTGADAALANGEVNAYEVGTNGEYLEQESGDGLPLILSADRVAIATYRFETEEGLSEVEFEVAPGGQYEYAYWWKDLDGRTDGRTA